MATNVPQTEADCTCSICCDFFNDPAVLLCGHSFCQPCLQEWWRQSRLRTCPVCKDIFPMAQPPRNIALKNLSESLRQERSRKAAVDSNELCQLHGERFKLFCQKDQQPICVICRDAKAHKTHNCVPVGEAAEEFRASLQTNLLNLKSKRGSFEQEKQKCDKMTAHIQSQAQQTEKKIRAEFQKLYQFLRAEEARRIDACRREAAVKSDAMKVRISNLTAEISEIREKIKTTEEEIRKDDLSFMLNVRTTMKRSLCDLPEPETPRGALLNEAKHTGNLQFIIWKTMADAIQYTPVTLDPNSACKSLTVSENLTSSTESEKSQPVPDNPDRLRWCDVLGCEAFNSGKHSWDVEVGGWWAVGVAAKTTDLNPVKTWAIYMCPCTNILRNLTLEDYVTEIAEDSFPQKVRVKLDYEQGVLSFFDLDRNKTVHTIRSPFTETVFPYFRGNAKVLPTKVSVRIMQQKTQDEEHSKLRNQEKK